MIERLYVHNYRCFENFQLDFAGHSSQLLIGQFITGLRKMTNRRGQFVATTHHPETVRKFSDETTFVLSRKSHLDPTVVRPLADFNYRGDLINALIRDEIIG